MLKGEKVLNKTISPSALRPSALPQRQLLKPVLLQPGAAHCASQKLSEILALAPSLLGGSWEHWDPLQGLPCAGGKIQRGWAALKQEPLCTHLTYLCQAAGGHSGGCQWPQAMVGAVVARACWCLAAGSLRKQLESLASTCTTTPHPQPAPACPIQMELVLLLTRLQRPWKRADKRSCAPTPRACEAGRGYSRIKWAAAGAARDGAGWTLGAL